VCVDRGTDTFYEITFNRNVVRLTLVVQFSKHQVINDGFANAPLKRMVKPSLIEKRYFQDFPWNSRCDSGHNSAERVGHNLASW
jgi:hypothetical protein